MLRFLLKNKKIKIDEKDINLIFYELNIMLQANLVVSDAFDILIKNKNDKQIKDFLKDLKYSLLSSKSSLNILKKYDLDLIVISFMQICQKNGNLKSNIYALNSLLKDSMTIKNDFKKAIRYPLILLFTMFSSINVIFYFVIPKFKTIFKESNDSLPLATKLLFFTYDIYINYFLYILFIFLLLFFSIYIYSQNSIEIKYKIDKTLITKIFFIKDIILSSELFKLFLILNIMTKSNYEFIKALNSSKLLLKNQYLLDRISFIENLLKNGKSISFSFKQSNLFDDLTLNLIHTAEASNSLDVILNEIMTIYKNRFTEKIKILIVYIEPIFLVIIVSLILWIILAIFIPIWDMGNIIKT